MKITDEVTIQIKSSTCVEEFVEVSESDPSNFRNLGRKALLETLETRKNTKSAVTNLILSIRAAAAAA